LHFIIIGMLTGLLTGMMMSTQGALNAALADKIGTFGSIFVVASINLVLVGLIILFIPNSVTLQNLPGWDSWYLYLGGVLGVFILAAINIIIPRYGATQSFLYIISGQLIASLFIDHYGYLGVEESPINLTKILGIIIFLFGVYLVNLSKAKG
jgi:transporter family-2 protein